MRVAKPSNHHRTDAVINPDCSNCGKLDGTEMIDFGYTDGTNYHVSYTLCADCLTKALALLRPIALIGETYTRPVFLIEVEDNEQEEKQ